MAVKMLSSYATKALGDIVTEQLKAFVEDPLKQAFTSITGITLANPGADDLKKLQDKLSEISKQLVGINNGISSLASVVDEKFFGVKEDMLWTSTNSINTAWESYVEMVQNYNDPGSGKTAASIRQSLINLLQGEVDKIPEQMNTIHHYLVDSGDNSLLAQACKVQRGKNKDVITFYVSMKNYLHNFLLVQARGLALLYIMHIDPAINIGNAQQVIDKVKPRLAIQESWLRDKFGSGTYDLVTRILGTQDHNIKATLAYNGDAPLRVWRWESPGSTGYGSGLSAETGNPWTPWEVMPVDCNLDTVDSTTDYQFRLVYTDRDYGLGWFFGTPGGASDALKASGAGPADDNNANAWVLVPSENDFVRLLYKKRNGGKDGITYLYRDNGFKYRSTGDTDTSNQNFALRAV